MKRSCWRRTWKEFGERRYRPNRGDECWSCRWPGPGVGRYWKRCLSKARRHYYKLQDRGVRVSYPLYYESMANWKTW